MSHTNRFSTTMTETAHLAAALRELGFNFTQHATPQPLQVYHGAEPALAEFIIPKSELSKHGAYGFGDVGFARKSDGTFELVGDGTDISYMQRAFAGRRNQETGFIDTVAQRYAEEMKKEWAISQGYIFVERTEVEVDGQKQVNLTYMVRE